jgi:hypothetical protein
LIFNDDNPKDFFCIKFADVSNFYDVADITSELNSNFKENRFIDFVYKNHINARIEFKKNIIIFSLDIDFF